MEKHYVLLGALTFASMAVPVLSFYKDHITNQEQNKNHLELVERLIQTQNEMIAAKLELTAIRGKVAQVNETVTRLEQAKEISPKAAGAIKNVFVEVVGTDVKVDAGVVDVVTHPKK